MINATQLRKIFGVFLATIAFLISSAVGNSINIQAAARPLTPEASTYEIDGADSSSPLTRNAPKAVKDATEDTKGSLQRAADNVREKLNLDQPVPQSTKDFFNDVQGKVDETVEPITGDQPGYYKSDR